MGNNMNEISWTVELQEKVKMKSRALKLREIGIQCGLIMVFLLLWGVLMKESFVTFQAEKAWISGVGLFASVILMLELEKGLKGRFPSYEIMDWGTHWAVVGEVKSKDWLRVQSEILERNQTLNKNSNISKNQEGEGVIFLNVPPGVPLVMLAQK